MHAYCFHIGVEFNHIPRTDAMRDKCDRRSGIERRQIAYDAHIPENRITAERRSGHDRRSPANESIPQSSERRNLFDSHSDE